MDNRALYGASSRTSFGLALEEIRLLSNAERVRHLRLKALGTLGALTLGSCLVYGNDDLPSGAGGNGGRSSGGGGAASGGAKGGTGFGGTSPQGGAAGNGPAGAGPGGAGGGGEGGEAGAGQEGGSSFGGNAGNAGVGAKSAGGNGGASLGGSSGGVATGGTGGGSGGAITNPELIDNMEDGNQFIEYNEKRSGLWYTAADTAKGASADPPPNAFAMAELPAEAGTAPNSTWAFHFIGVGGKSDAWGALAGIDLINPVGTMKTPYDASKYKGLHFWAKAETEVTIRVRLVLKGTLAEAGGACGTGCNNHPYLNQPLTEQWKEYTLRWDQDDPEQIPFKQEPWGTRVPFNPAELVEIQFVVPPTSKTADFWIDDISFVP